jgi:hypothetical protein
MWPPPHWFQQPPPANDGWGGEPPEWARPDQNPTGMAQDTAGLLGLGPTTTEPQPTDWNAILGGSVAGAMPSLPEYAQGPKGPPERYPFAPEIAGPPPKPMGMGAKLQPALPPPPVDDDQVDLDLTNEPAEPRTIEAPPDMPFPERQRGYARAEADSLMRQGDIEANAAEREGMQRELSARHSMLQQAQDLDHYERAMTESRAKRDELAAESERLAKAKIDPSRFWSDAGTPAKIGMAITAILGGWLGAKNGGKNQGLELIQNIIDRDLAAQESDMANRRDSLAFRRGLLGDQMAATGNLFEARMAVRSAMYTRAADAITADALQNKAPMYQEQGLQLAAKVLAARDQGLQGYEDAMRAQMLAQPRRGGGGPKPPKVLDPKNPRMVLGIAEDDGTPVEYRGNEADAQKFNAKKNGAESIITMAHTYKDKRREIEGGGVKWDNWLKSADGVQWLTTFGETAKTTYAVANGQGAISKDDNDRYGNIFVELDWSPVNMKRIDEAMDAVATSAEIGINAEFRNNTTLGLGDRGRKWRYSPSTGKWYQPPTGKAGAVSRDTAVGTIGGNAREGMRGMKDYIQAMEEGKLRWMKDSAGNVAFYDLRDPRVAKDLESGRLTYATAEEIKGQRDFNTAQDKAKQEQERDSAISRAMVPQPNL